MFSCAGVTCRMPQQAPHVMILNPAAEYLYKDHLIYECQDGYALRGPDSRECILGTGTTGKWSEYDPVCLRKYDIAHWIFTHRQHFYEMKSSNVSIL